MSGNASAGTPQAGTQQAGTQQAGTEQAGTQQAGTQQAGTQQAGPVPSSPPPAADRISLTGLRVRGNHGVFDFERSDGQDFVVDVELELDTRTAAATDQLSDTVHYGELAEALAAVIAGEPVNLLETLADRLAGVCLADARVNVATVTVHKPQAPIPLQFADVAVTIRRTRTETSPGIAPTSRRTGAR